MLRAIQKFLAEDLWEIEARRLAPWQAAGLTVLRVVVHTARAFLTDLGSLSAAGLTLVTLLAVVPLLALASGIAKGLGYEETLRNGLDQLWREAPEDLQPAIQQIQELVDRTSFGALGAIGSLVLVYSGMVLYVRVEQAFNKAWRVTRGRSWYRRVTDFVALVVLVPVLVIAALSLQSLLKSATWFQDVAWLQGLYEAGLGFVPHVLVWIAFTALYRLMPSAPVKWSTAAVAGVVAGSGWLFVHDVYLSTQVSVARLNPIYGTLAALPLLLIYLQVTWTIVLVGADVSYAVQHRHRLTGTRPRRTAAPVLRLRLALFFVARVCRDFSDGKGGYETATAAEALDVPEYWIEDVFDELAVAGILGRVDGREAAIVPLRPPDQITFADVFGAIQGDIPPEVNAALALPGPLETRVEQVEAAVREALEGGNFGGSQTG